MINMGVLLCQMWRILDEQVLLDSELRSWVANHRYQVIHEIARLPASAFSTDLKLQLESLGHSAYSEGTVEVVEDFKRPTASVEAPKLHDKLQASSFLQPISLLLEENSTQTQIEGAP